MTQRARDLGLFILALGAAAGFFAIHREPGNWVFAAVAILFSTALLARLLTIPHEFAHALFGLWAGLDVTVVLLGGGRVIARGKWLGFAWELGRQIGPGTTLAMPRGPEHLRRRMALMILGGPVFHALMLTIALPIAWRWWSPEPAGAARIGQVLLQSFVLANAIMLAGCLAPHVVRSGGRKLPSDGLQWLRLRNLQAADVTEMLVQRWLVVAWQALRHGEAVQAEVFCRNALQITPGHVGARLNLAWALLNQRDLDHSRALAAGVLAQTVLPRQMRGMGLWLLIWNDILLGTETLYGEAANSAAELAGYDPDSIDHLAARGAALICAGQSDEGLGLLYKAMAASDILEHDVDVLSLAALGEAKRGKMFEAKRRLGQAQRCLQPSVLLTRAREAINTAT